MTTKLTVEVEDDLAVRVAAAATESGVAPEALAAEIRRAVPAAAQAGVCEHGSLDERSPSQRG